MEAVLGRGVDVVGHKGVTRCRHGLVADRVAAALEHERVTRKFGLHVVAGHAGGDELREPRQHVERGDRFGDLEERLDLAAHPVDELLDRAVAEEDDFVVRVSELLIEFDEVKGLAFDVVLLLDRVDEDGGDSSRGIQVAGGEAEMVLSSRFVFEIEYQLMLICRESERSRILRGAAETPLSSLKYPFTSSMSSLYVRRVTSRKEFTPPYRKVSNTSDIMTVMA